MTGWLLAALVTTNALRYLPDGSDFVITNGPEFFNRPLYGGNTAFRVDAGDKPEFSLYLPGRGGNLRLGVHGKWLNDADKIIARYRPGSMIYEIEDAGITIKLTAYAFDAGLLVRAESSPPVELVWAYGGANGERGRRGGDIGCEREPVSQFFQLKPEYCRGNTFEITPNSFRLRDITGQMTGQIADAKHWSSLPDLLASAGQPTDTPVIVGRVKLPAELVLGRATKFGDLESRRRAIAGQVAVETPDPFLNAAAPALCVAADGVWDKRDGVFMHGAVAWRTKLPGWRGAYAGDALGWHDRTRRHLEYWAARQNTNAIPAELPAEDSNLSRREAALHTNGDITNSHYDMNLVFVDIFFRHLLWTGDLEFARKMWPVLQRHLAWEQRLFKRPNGLYEAYACIWASDDLAYNGGGATHSSAYNYYHNKMAARLAKLLGEDPTPFEREAESILQAMRRELWVGDHFAEWKDWLGRQLVHSNAAVWTFYHAMDSEVPTPEEARQLTRYVDAEIPHIPVREDAVTVSTTSWMPYTWSLNNVVVAETAHTALGYWQAGRADKAFRLFKGCILDTMFMGLCPGNVGMTTRNDAVRGEAQRDFADGIGVLSRALVEGLFGVVPDAMAGELLIRPGFPAAWTNATLRHPDIALEFRRAGLTDTFVIEPNFPRPMALRLLVPAGVTNVAVNGRSADWRPTERGVEITAGPASHTEIILVRDHLPAPEIPHLDVTYVTKKCRIETGQTSGETQTGGGSQTNAATNWATVKLGRYFNDNVTQIFRNEYRSPRSPFCSLAIPKQGIGSWCHPEYAFEVDDRGLRAAGTIRLPGGVPLVTPRTGSNVVFVSQWDNYPREISVPLTGKASRAWLLMAGSTNPMQSRFDNGEVLVTYADGATGRLALRNPTTWWPIDQDYFINEFAFRLPGPTPLRVDLKTGNVRSVVRPGKIDGGAATVLEMALNPARELKTLTVRALANEVVIGLMAVTLGQ